MASAREHAAVVAAAVAAHDINRIQGFCARVFVSTVDARWTSLDFPEPPSKPCEMYTADGIALFHWRHGRWHFVTAGSSFRCPIRGVPMRVAHDFKVC
jgi:hypothetical protein